MNASVDMLGARIHATTFDEEDTCIVILRYESRRSLLISQNLHDPPEIHAIERALQHAIEFALSAGNGGHGLTLRRPTYYCHSEHDSPSADTPAIIGSSMICILPPDSITYHKLLLVAPTLARVFIITH